MLFRSSLACVASTLSVVPLVAVQPPVFGTAEPATPVQPADASDQPSLTGPPVARRLRTATTLGVHGVTVDLSRAAYPPTSAVARRTAGGGNARPLRRRLRFRRSR